MADGLGGVVGARAAHRGEYCRLPESASRLRHVSGHVVARQHRGPTSLNNLALCCGQCNRFKGPNIATLDTLDGAVQPSR